MGGLLLLKPSPSVSAGVKDAFSGRLRQSGKRRRSALDGWPAWDRKDAPPPTVLFSLLLRFEDSEDHLSLCVGVDSSSFPQKKKRQSRSGATDALSEIVVPASRTLHGIPNHLVVEQRHNGIGYVT
jgi:hypothetical protein